MLTDTPQPLMNHLLDLRRRLLYSLAAFFLAFCICYIYSEAIFQFLAKPLARIFEAKGQERRLIYTSLTEAFLTYVKVAAFGSLFVSFPLIASQIWLFIAPALYKNERILCLGLLTATPVLFFMGATFAYMVIFPMAYEFFLSFENLAHPGTMAIQLEAKVNEYLSFVLRLIFAFGVCFELPILLTLLCHVGMLNRQSLIEKWRIAVLIIFIVSAFITPPDILSMLGLAVPLILLYAVSIIMITLLENKKRKTLPHA
jgi:sec-independent protein translocase protein TatC